MELPNKMTIDLIGPRGHVGTILAAALRNCESVFADLHQSQQKAKFRLALQDASWLEQEALTGESGREPQLRSLLNGHLERSGSAYRLLEFVGATDGKHYEFSVMPI